MLVAKTQNIRKNAKFCAFAIIFAPLRTAKTQNLFAKSQNFCAFAAFCAFAII